MSDGTTTTDRVRLPSPDGWLALPVASYREALEFAREHPICPPSTTASVASPSSHTDNRLTAAQLARKLQIGRKKIERYAREGVLKCERIGRTLRFDWAEIEPVIKAGLPAFKDERE